MGEVTAAKPNPLVISGTAGTDQIYIEGVKDGHLHYELNGKATSQPIVPGQTIEVNLAKPRTEGGDATEVLDQGVADEFVVGPNANLEEYQLLVNGSRGDDRIGFASGAKLGDVTVLAGQGGDLVEAGEGVSVKHMVVRLGENAKDTSGKVDVFHAFNRYADETYRHPAGGTDKRFTDEGIKEKLQQEGKSLADLQRQSGFTAEEIWVEGSAGKDMVLIGSHADIKKAHIDTYDAGDSITLMNQVKGDFTLDGGEGMDSYWIGEREGLAPVRIEKGDTVINTVSIHKPGDITFTDPDQQALFELLSVQMVSGQKTLTEAEREKLLELLEKLKDPEAVTIRSHTPAKPDVEKP